VNSIRALRPDERQTILEIINAAAQRYRGIIPEDRWHDPYMSADELETQITEGVEFHGLESYGEVLGVMGIQHMTDVDLIRHAYVRPGSQGSGIGGTLLTHLLDRAEQPVLIGTWADATWAIKFYERHGFEVVPEEEKDRLLRKYWRIPERQIETSVVLRARPTT
jgi:N-acetylglutamate synthase-like GNAT family acetyltransferase